MKQSTVATSFNEYSELEKQQNERLAEIEQWKTQQARRREDKAKKQAEAQSHFTNLTDSYLKERAEALRKKNDSIKSVPFLKRMRTSIRNRLNYLRGKPPIKASNHIIKSNNALADLLKTNALFDSQWYLRAYPDIAKAGIDPVEHYLNKGSEEGRNPNPLFDTAWYLKTYPDIAKAGVNPLIHYIQMGAIEGRNPHPLFETTWYIKTYPESEGLNPLNHYINSSNVKGYSPCPLFDGKWYIDTYLDVAESGMTALEHYLEFGSVEGRNPNPIFNTHWYLQTYPEADNEQLSALEHYIAIGALKGYNPSPWFDAAWYTKTYPNFDASKALEHYLNVGRHQNYLTSPHFNVVKHNRPVEILRLPEPELSVDAISIEKSPKNLLCLWNTSPFPTSGGDEYRLERLLRWFKAQQWRITLVIISNEQALPETLEMQKLSGLCKFLRLGKANVATNIPIKSSDIYSLFTDPYSHDKVESTKNDLTSVLNRYCPIPFLRALSLISSQNQYGAVIAENVFAASAFRLLPSSILKLIAPNGLAINLSQNSEGLFLKNADIVMGIGPDDVRYLNRLHPSTTMIEVSIDHEVSKRTPNDLKNNVPTVLINGFNNKFNLSGIRAFLDFVWPIILQAIPAAQLHVIGPIASELPSHMTGVILSETIINLDEAYSQAWVAVNPVQQGTAAKVKTEEAIAHFRRVVVFPAGAENMKSSLLPFYAVALDAVEMGEMLVKMLSGDVSLEINDADISLIRDALSTDTIYSELNKVLV